jgi:hypothetical protein
VDAVRAGHSYAAAARAGRIDEATLHRWLARGRDGEELYRAFCDRFEQADQEAEHRCVHVLKSALEGDDAKLATDTAWKWLARRRPAQWGEKPVESKGTGADEQAADDLEVTRSVLAALESRKAG